MCEFQHSSSYIMPRYSWNDNLLSSIKTAKIYIIDSEIIPNHRNGMIATQCRDTVILNSFQDLNLKINSGSF